MRAFVLVQIADTPLWNVDKYCDYRHEKPVGARPAAASTCGMNRELKNCTQARAQRAYTASPFYGIITSSRYPVLDYGRSHTLSSIAPVRETGCLDNIVVDRRGRFASPGLSSRKEAQMLAVPAAASAIGSA